MDRIPFGVSRLDSIVGGGAPTGSVVLLAGDLGAGAREFLYTSAAMNGLARTDEDLFDLYYGSLAGNARLPEEVHYLSFTDDRANLVREMRHLMDDELVDAGLDPVEFVDLSPEYFSMSKVPTEWYSRQTPSIASLGDRESGRRDVLDAVGDYLSNNADDSLVLVDSVTDLVSAASESMSRNDVNMLMKGLKKASRKWEGLVLLLVNRESMSEVELGRLMEATDGSILFEWESGGSERARTMFVQKFRGVLSRLEDEEIIRFETEIHDGGFDVSNVRKIR